MRKAYFQYYETFEKIVQKFNTADERESLRTKIINYGLYGTEPESLSDKEIMVWDIIKDLIDDQIHRREVNRKNRELKKQAEQQQPKASEEKQPAEKKKFAKPTPEEVKEYCKERKNNINAQQFVDYYEARGWRIGNSNMKDWKAAVRTWEQRSTGSTNGYSNSYEWPQEKLTL